MGRGVLPAMDGIHRQTQIPSYTDSLHFFDRPRTVSELVLPARRRSPPPLPKQNLASISLRSVVFFSCGVMSHAYHYATLVVSHHFSYDHTLPSLTSKHPSFTVNPPSLCRDVHRCTMTKCSLIYELLLAQTICPFLSSTLVTYLRGSTPSMPGVKTAPLEASPKVIPSCNALMMSMWMSSGDVARIPVVVMRYGQ